MCPYIIENETQATMIFYDEQGHETGSVISKQWRHPTCLKKKCGAYVVKGKKGRCTYQDRS